MKRFTNGRISTKKFLLLVLPLFFVTCQLSAQIVWQEDFQSIGDGATNNSPKWVTTAPSGGTFRKETSLFYSGIFWIENTNTEGEWRTENIDISAYGIAIIDINFISFNARSSDYIRVFYKVNGGPETPLIEFVGSGFEQASAGSGIVIGNTLQIIIRASETSPGQFFGLIPTYLAFDNLTVTGVETLYSRKSGNWNDNSSNSTWSPYPISNGVVGASCGCVPDNNKRVVIQNGHTIDFNVNAGATILEVESGGTLRWSADSRSLSVYRGGYVINNGNINRNGRTDARLVYPQAFNYAITSHNNNFTLDDIQLTAGASVTLNGSGRISLSDELMFSAGGATVNNYTTLTFTALNAGTNNITLNNYGTINQSEGFTHGNGSNLYNQSGGTWNWSYAGGATSLPSASLNCSATGNTFNYSAAGAQGVRNITYHNVTFSNSGEKRTNGNLTINGNLLISGNAQLNVDTGNNNITIGGNWTVTSSNADPFLQGNGATNAPETVTFNGSSNQTFTRAGGDTFNRIMINKPGGSLILANNLTITNGSGEDLTLTRGIVQSSASALLVIPDGATTNGGNANSFVDGPIKKIGNDTFVFPTGDGSRWARIEITAPSSINTEFTAQYFATKHTHTTANTSLHHVSWAEYWTLDRQVTTNNVAVTLYWQNTFSDISNTTDLRVARFNGTNWVSEGNASRSGGPNSGWVRSDLVSNFNAFTFGSFGGINILPVELTHFSATLNNNVVEVNWKTATELNNDYFTVERASNLEQFEEVKQVKGKGTTNEAQHYSIQDPNPLHGRSYYRLKQIDYDGTITYSKLQVVDYEGPLFGSIHTYPNPGTGKALNIELSGLKNIKQLPLQIFNSQGVVVYQNVFKVNESGFIQEDITFANALPPGFYIVKAGENLLLVSKIIVQ